VNEQATLFGDPPKKRRARRDPRQLPDWKRERDIGMARAEANAEEKWTEMAEKVLRFFAESRDEFSGWEITRELRAMKLKTGSERAMGPVLVRAAKSGLIAKTDRTEPNPLAHGCPSPIWRSRIRRVS
jgi:hypothetical protein